MAFYSKYTGEEVEERLDRITNLLPSTQETSVKTPVAWIKDVIATVKRGFAVFSSSSDSYLWGISDTSKLAGAVLRISSTDKYLRVLRARNGAWQSTDFEKISAGYADSAGMANSAAYDGEGNEIHLTYVKKDEVQGGSAKKELIVRRAVSCFARTGDKYYFQDGIIKFDWSFTKNYNEDEFDKFLDSITQNNFPNGKYWISQPSEKAKPYGIIYTEGMEQTGAPVFIKTLPHGDVLDASWFEVIPIDIRHRNFSCKTRSPYFEVVGGQIICTKPISKEQARHCFEDGMYHCEGMFYVRCKSHASVTEDSHRRHYGNKLRLKHHGNRIRLGLHKVSAIHRGYRSIQYTEIYPTYRDVLT